MPQLQAMVLKDRAATPNDVTFTPRDITNGVAKVASSTGVPVGEKTFTMSTRVTPESGKRKVTLRMALPVVQNQDIGGIINPVVVRTAYVDATFSFDRNSTEDERNDAVGLFQSALSETQVLTNGILVNLEGVY